RESGGKKDSKCQKNNLRQDASGPMMAPESGSGLNTKIMCGAMIL
ncbi:unnamed protein product, partial [marine sediment metagenome]